MARVITELLADSSRLETMKRNCIREAHRFSWEVEMQKLLAEYDRLVSH
jgi:glycosyltransferase involved in cell wall biosynthesis